MKPMRQIAISTAFLSCIALLVGCTVTMGAGADDESTSDQGTEQDDDTESAGAAGAAADSASGAGGADSVEADPVIETVATVGVGVSPDDFCGTGSFTVTVQPTDADGKLVSVDAEEIMCTAAQGTDTLECTVASSECISGSDSENASTAVLVILDQSGSMDDNDPDGQRAEACASFIGQLGAGDFVAVSEFGNYGGTGMLALQTVQDFTDDKELARAACGSVTGPAGTPIYGSVLDAVNQFYPAAQENYGADVNFAVLMLSDGEPDSDTGTEEEAMQAAVDADVPFYTVGLGPAAEGSDTSNVTAVGVLQGISEATGGAYASSVDATQLDALFEQVGSAVRVGRCQISATISAESFTSGEAINGTLIFSGETTATTTYTFTVPVSAVDGSKCI